MKIFIFLALFLSGITYGADKLPSTKDKNMCWLGVDFSIAKFIGKSDFKNPEEIQSLYFKDWNGLLIKEEWVHTFERPLGLKSISFDTDNARENNSKIDMNHFIQDSAHDINESQVIKLVSGYDYGAVTQELAISFVVESFNKKETVGEVWVVFNYLKLGTVFTKKIIASPSGLGLRSYWMGALRKTIEITNNKAKLWMEGKE